MVRIAHFTEAAVDGVNGIAASIRLLTAELSRQGHDNLVVSAGPLWGHGRDGVLWVRSAPTGMGDFRWVLRPRAAMHDHVRAWQPDVAHVHTPGPLGAAAMAVAREIGIPAVYTYHTDMHGYSEHYHIPTPVIRAGTAFYGRHLKSSETIQSTRQAGKYDAVEAANARIFAAAQVIIVPTAGALRRHRTADAYADRIRVVPTPPADHDDGATDFRERFGIPPEAAVVLFVGRLSAEKGIPLLLDAFARLSSERTGTKLVLAGPQARRLALRRRIVAAGLTERTVVTGTLNAADVRAAYRAADLFAFPSVTDTQGIVLHEAALAGLPIVMVDRDLAAGHPLGAAVRLAEPDADALADALRSLLESEEAATELGRHGRETARALTAESFAEQALAAYRDAVTSVAARG